MFLTVTRAAALLLACASGPLLYGEARFKNWPVQIHGFASQGFAKSDNNNYLTMKTSGGSFAFTDGGVNASVQITDKLRVGAQLYVRRIGTLGGGYPVIDWAVVDYKVNDWLGVRGGKVKTVFGLYNDSQDMESLHTWAILPQAVYSLDLRSSNIAHLGGDAGGEHPLAPNRGSLSYTVYVGRRFDDRNGGYRNVARQNGVELDTVAGRMAGGDLRWINIVPGLSLGGSYFEMPFKGAGKLTAFNIPVRFNVQGKSRIIFADYLHGNLHFTAEASRATGGAEVIGLPGISYISEPSLGWYASLAYRISPYLELGSYHSRFVSDTTRAWDDPTNHIYDQAISARFDINRHWSVKAEGHLIDGYGSAYSAHGFYVLQNQNGFERKTNMFVFRTGYTF